MKIVEIDRSKSLAQQAHTGHNRWHPDIPAIVEADPEEEVVLQTRDSMDGQFNARTTEADFTKLNAGLIHPLTGPVFIKGAKPGDLLEVEFVDIRPEPFAFTCIVPGLGFLPDVFLTPFIVKWKIENNFATSDHSRNPERRHSIPLERSMLHPRPFSKTRPQSPLLFAAGFDRTDQRIPWLANKRLHLYFG